jgi:hypothetical protein
MTSTLQKLVGVAVSAFVLGGTFVAAAAIGDARHDDATVTPAAEVASTPVAAAGDPVPFGEEPDADAEATWPAPSASQPLDEPAEARARMAGPVPTDDPGVIQPISSAADADPTSPTSTTAGETSTTAARDEAEPASEDTTLRSLGLLGGLVDLPWFRFLDPCADAEDESCGEGTGGTILPFGGGTAAEPLRLGSSLYEFIAITALGEQCNIGTRADGSVGVILFSNNPVDLEVTWWPVADPTDVHDAGPFETTEEQRREWDIDRAEGRTPTPDAGGVLTCLEFPRAMTHGVRHQVHVEGTDLYGSTDSATYGLTPPAPRTTSGGTSGGRPPVRFSPIDERGGKVVAALDDAQEEQLWVAELVRNGPDATAQDCTSIENEVLGRLRGASTRLFNEDVVPLIIPDVGGTYPYERRFDTAVSVEYWPGEGVAATICAWITKPAVRSFDRPQVLQRTTLDVTAPRWYRTRITATEAHLDRAVGEDPVTARVEEGGFSAFGSVGRTEVLAPGTEPGLLTLDEPIVIADSGASMHPYQATVAVATTFGEIRTVVETPNKLCPVTPPSGALCPTSFRDTVTVRIPGPRAGSGLCGSSFGECEPPTTETFLGELTLVVESYAGPSGPPAYGEGFGGWDVATGRFAAADDPEPTPYARLDWNRSTAVASSTASGQRPVVTLVMMADRPVTATASSVGWDRTGECGLQPQSSTTLSVNHVFRWDAACFGTSYFLEAVLTDAAGRETRFGPGGEQHLAGIVDTGGFELVSIDFDVAVTPKTPMDFAELDLYIGGGEVPMTAGSTGRCRDDVRRREGVIRNAGGYPLRVGEPLYVGLTGALDAGDECDEWDRIDLSGRVSLEGVLAGPVELRFEDDRVEVVVTLRAVGRVPLAPRTP